MGTKQNFEVKQMFRARFISVSRDFTLHFHC